MGKLLPPFQEKVLRAILALNDGESPVEATLPTIRQHMGILQAETEPNIAQIRIGKFLETIHINGTVRKTLMTAFASPVRDEIAEAIRALTPRYINHPALAEQQHAAENNDHHLKYFISRNGRKYIMQLDSLIQNGITEPARLEYFLD